MKPLFHKDITHNSTDLTITAIMAQRLDVQNQPEAPCSRLAADIQSGSFHRTHLDTHLDSRRSFRGALTPEYNTPGDRFTELSHLDTPRPSDDRLAGLSHLDTHSLLADLSHTCKYLPPHVSQSFWLVPVFFSSYTLLFHRLGHCL